MRCRRWIGAWALGLLVIGGALAIAEEGKPASGKDETLVVKEKGGTRFLSLSDWPTARKGGVVKAAPLEEYLSMKFGQMNESLERLTKRLDALEQQMTKVEEERGALLDRLKALGEQQQPSEEVAHGDTTESGGEAAEGTTSVPPQADDGQQVQPR